MSRIFACCFLFLLFAGCSGGNVRFGGQVTFSDDQTPLTHGVVCFVSGNHIARGILQSDGTYVMSSSADKNDGLPPGTYQVYVSDPYELFESTPENPEGIGPILIDPKFTDPKTSGLSVEVSGQNRKFDFKVDRK